MIVNEQGGNKIPYHSYRFPVLIIYSLLKKCQIKTLIPLYIFFRSQDITILYFNDELWLYIQQFL